MKRAVDAITGEDHRIFRAFAYGYLQRLLPKASRIHLEDLVNLAWLRWYFPEDAAADGGDEEHEEQPA